MVLDPHPQKRHKRFDGSVLQALEAIKKGSPDEMLLQALWGLGAVSLRELLQHAHLSENEALQMLQHLVKEGQIINWKRGKLPRGRMF